MGNKKTNRTDQLKAPGSKVYGFDILIRDDLYLFRKNKKGWNSYSDLINKDNSKLKEGYGAMRTARLIVRIFLHLMLKDLIRTHDAFVFPFPGSLIMSITEHSGKGNYRKQRYKYYKTGYLKPPLDGRIHDLWLTMGRRFAIRMNIAKARILPYLYGHWQRYLMEHIERNGDTYYKSDKNLWKI